MDTEAEKIAVITERGKYITYQELGKQIRQCVREITGKPLLLLLCDDSYENLVIYLSCLWGRIPVILLGRQDRERVTELTEVFPVDFLWLPDGVEGGFGQEGCQCFGHYLLCWNEGRTAGAAEISEDLALLLPTSGSQGESKLVMLSYDNIVENARSIIQALEIQSTDRAALMLPLCYSYGLSVIHTHLLAGATLLLPESSMISTDFWRFLERENVTSLAGVPSGYELIRRLRILEGKYHFPHLRMVTQAGGALGVACQKYILEQIKKWENLVYFAVMYGQTEATARITSFFLEEHEEHMGSVGRVIPGGKLWIEGRGQAGEICYQGVNVFVGYADRAQDLGECPAPAPRVLHTGDMGYLDREGFLYVTGRKKRFAKINGYRIGLDRLQGELSRQLECEVICVSAWREEKERIFICWTDKSVQGKDVERLLWGNRKLAGSYVLQFLEEFPHRENGKIDYSRLGGAVLDSSGGMK